jgi:Uncharacterized conserved protein
LFNLPAITRRQLRDAIVFQKSSLNIVKGKNLLKEFNSSTYGIRVFCGHCGSRLMNYAAEKSDYMSVALACITTAHTIKASAHVQVASKAPWVTPNEKIPSFNEFPEDIGQYF